MPAGDRLNIAERSVRVPHLLAHQLRVARRLEALAQDLRVVEQMAQFRIILHDLAHLWVGLEHRA